MWFCLVCLVFHGLFLDPLVIPSPLGCHLYSINTHHGVELRIVAAIRNKLLLITRKQPRPDGFGAVAMGADSPVEEFQYIRVGSHTQDNALTSSCIQYILMSL